MRVVSSALIATIVAVGLTSVPAAAAPSPTATPSATPFATSSESSSEKPDPAKPEEAIEPPVKSSVSKAEAIRQAQHQISELAKATKVAKQKLAAAQAAEAKVLAHIEQLAGEINAARATQVATARHAYMAGIDPGILDSVSAVTNADPSSFAQVQKSLETVYTAKRNEEHAAQTLLAEVEAQRVSAAAAVADAKSKAEVAASLEQAARDMLAIAQGGDPGAAAKQRFETYSVSDCSFDTPPNPNTCQQAQQWALNQVANPTRDWYRSCLNFVTEAYGVVGGANSAIAHWNALPASQRHPPTTVAPAGALMFWGPNHVALSMGNNVLISTDVLGNGRAWIVSFAEMQTVWHLEYLGWAPPDFTHS